MKTRNILAAVACAAALLTATGATVVSAAETIELNAPGKAPENLKPGLKVSYVYEHIRLLLDAITRESKAKEGPPLVGFDYPNTVGDQPALTSEKATGVIAYISGYIHFEKKGEYELEFWSNDGLLVKIQDQTISRYDARTPCTSPGPVKVVAPEPGWYPLKAMYFQRYKTSCLLMKMRAPDTGRLTWASNDIFAYQP